MTRPVRIPADVDLPDRVLGPFTARQLLVLAATAAALYGLWQALRGLVPVFLACATPVLAAAAAVLLGRRDGLSLDRLLCAAVRHHLAGTRRVAAPEGDGPVPAWLAAAATPLGGRREQRRPQAWEAPAHGVSAAGRDAGVVDLGGQGLALIAAASTVNFALQTPTEQEALVAGFGRYLHSLTGPVQILIRAQPLDLTDQITHLLASAPVLPDAGLSRLAHDHAAFLTQLSAQTELLCRQVLLVWREPAGPDDPAPTRRGRRSRRQRRGLGDSARRAAEERLLRRFAQAAELLGPLGITVTALDPVQTAAILTATGNPGLPRPANPAPVLADIPVPPHTESPLTERDDPGWRPDIDPRAGGGGELDDEAIEARNQYPTAHPAWPGGRP